MQDYVTPLPLALIVALHASCLTALLLAVASRPRSRDGWNVIRPGSVHWFCFLGGWALSLFVSWVWIFVGNDLCDSEQQLRVALLLLSVFGLSGLFFGFHIWLLHWRNIRWSTLEVRWKGKRGEASSLLVDCVSYRWTRSGNLLLAFRDEKLLKLDQLATGVLDLAAAISERTGLDILGDSEEDDL